MATEDEDGTPGGVPGVGFDMALFTVLSAEDLATLDEGSALLAERPNPKLRLLFKDRLLGIRNRFLRSDELVEP